MRFRYQCEGRSAGSILGESSTENTKTVPAIAHFKLRRNSWRRKVKVCLVLERSPVSIHPQRLVGKDCRDGICEFLRCILTNDKPII
ncbi:unnamed protein product, partial [Ranitomeya imitator]